MYIEHTSGDGYRTNKLNLGMITKFSHAPYGKVQFKFEEDQSEYAEDILDDNIKLMSQSISSPIVGFTPLPKPRPEPEGQKKKQGTYGMRDLTQQILLDLEKEKEEQEQQRLRAQRQLQRQQEIERREREQREREEAERKRKQKEQQQRQARIQKEKQEQIRKQKERQEQAQKAKKEEEERRENQRRLELKKKEDEQRRMAQIQAAQKAQQLQMLQKKEKSLRQAPNLLFLTMVIRYAASIKQSKPTNLDVTNIQTVRRIIFNILQNSDDIVDQLQQLSPEEQNSHMVKLWTFIVNVLISGAKKDGIEQIPPISPQAEVYKNSINVFILLINILRVRGMERFWMYQVGKTLQLLDFIYKRKQQLKSYKDLDLVKKGYLIIKPEFESMYVSRLDQLTYFLFGLLSMDPYLAFRQIIERTRNERNGVGNRVESLNKPWDYSIFFVLVEQLRKAPFTHVKPFCYHNLFSMIYLQLRESIKGNREMNKFSNLYKQLVRDSATFIKDFNKSEECNMFEDTDDDLFEGTNLHSRIESLVVRIHKSRNSISEMTNLQRLHEHSILYFFTDFQKQ